MNKFFKISSRLRWSVLLLVLVLVPAISSAQKISPELLKRASQWEFDPSILSRLGLDARQLNRAYDILIEALEEGSLEALAPLRPYAEQVLSVAEQNRSFRPVAAWLRQRLDYFQVADRVVHQRNVAPQSSAITEDDYTMWLAKIRKRNPPARAAKYVPQLKPVFRAEGVPEEMVWLAEVESSFNPSAESPVGARGLYQFMPATAGRFGLAVEPVDDRLDPAKSAEAAAKYLRILHRQFGSWELALAAYNAGEGRVGRLLKSTQSSTFREIADDLPSETRMYVPKMRAVVQVREGVDLRTL